MTISQLVERLRTQFGNADVSSYDDFLAVQVNITGENPGVFYIEIKDHVLSIEPYEYNDRNAALTISMDNFLKLIDKKLDPVWAFTTGKLKAEGDVGKVLQITRLL